MRQRAQWPSIWPVLALLGALAAFGLGALVGVTGPSETEIWERHGQVTAALDGVIFNLQIGRAHV